MLRNFLSVQIGGNVFKYRRKNKEDFSLVSQKKQKKQQQKQFPNPLAIGKASEAENQTRSEGLFWDPLQR